MDENLEGTKTKTLAVFKNVITKKRKKKCKFKTYRFSEDEDSSPSESELVIDDDVKEDSVKRQRRSIDRVHHKNEVLALKCLWGVCDDVFSDMGKLQEHLECHAKEAEEPKCQWVHCPNPDDIPTFEMFLRHLSYHTYISKLINIGENILNRNYLPACSLKASYSIDIPYSGYTCEWEGCDNQTFNTIQDFFSHMQCHVLGAPTGKKRGSSEVIPCQWSGCGGKYPTRYKLADHLRVHTKERLIACPKCMALFASKTCFSDHRKRQLKTDMRSYQCSQCLKLFSVERLLSDHMRSHINQYKCTMCDMTLPKPSMLAKHYRYRHMNVRPFNCPHCSKSFVAKCNLTTHLLTHQEKPFQCDQCEFGCKSKVGLRSHMNKVHGLDSEVSYECEVCNTQFKRGDYLTHHLMKRHKFHWPSGHCRFRYRKDTDGVHRLQTVRYESLEVTEEMIRSESMPATKHPSAVTYHVSCDKDTGGEYKLTIQQGDSKKIIDVKPAKLGKKTNGPDIIITIEDLDESGNVVKTTEVNSREFCLEA
ncbi:histone H4 transcription factor-like [Euwallacea fornicatus]|uniref:histone H4 transcription factor-like n=1 Tax=Euwallacea fornicatus TaxID=995702 RepID=UPI00338F1D85